MNTDITFCSNKDCSLAIRCFRASCVRSESRHVSMCHFDPHSTEVGGLACDYFMMLPGRRFVIGQKGDD